MGSGDRQILWLTRSMIFMDRQEGNKEVYEADIYYNTKGDPNKVEVDLNKGMIFVGSEKELLEKTNGNIRAAIKSAERKGSFKSRIAKKLRAEKERQRRKIAASAKPKKKNLNFRELNEARRVYVFPGNNRVIVENVCRIAIMDSGIHRLETTTGEKHIIPTGWLQIKINSEGWNF